MVVSPTRSCQWFVANDYIQVGDATFGETNGVVLLCPVHSPPSHRPLLARGCLPRVVCSHIIICSMGRARRREDEWRRIRIKGIHETIVTDIVSIEVVVCRTLFPSHYIIIICIFQGTDNNSPGEQEEDWRPRRRHIQISFKGTQARMRIAACSS